MEHKPVRKAVIAAAGFGTRFLPQTKAMPKEMLPLIIEYVKQNPKWRVSLQTHKYMGIE